MWWRRALRAGARGWPVPRRGGECPEWACSGCGAGVFMGTVIMGTPAAGAGESTPGQTVRPCRVTAPQGRLTLTPPGHRALPGTTYAQAMRLADTPVPRGQADRRMRSPLAMAPTAAAGRDNSAPARESARRPVFAAAVAALEAGRDAVAEVRDDLDFEDWPAPKRLAPHAFALAATAYRDGEEAGDGQARAAARPGGAGAAGPGHVPRGGPGARRRGRGDGRRPAARRGRLVLAHRRA